MRLKLRGCPNYNITTNKFAWRQVEYIISKYYNENDGINQK